jgi:hypothetical protein
MECTLDEKCLIYTPQSYRIGLTNDLGEVTQIGHEIFHSQPPKCADYPHIKQPSPLPPTFKAVHWCDGEQAELNAVDSDQFKPWIEELELRFMQAHSKTIG